MQVWGSPNLILYGEGRIRSPNTTCPKFSAGELSSAASQKSKLKIIQFNSISHSYPNKRFFFGCKCSSWNFKLFYPLYKYNINSTTYWWYSNGMTDSSELSLFTNNLISFWQVVTSVLLQYVTGASPERKRRCLKSF